MKNFFTVIICFVIITLFALSCKQHGVTDNEDLTDTSLETYINNIQAVDNHAHPNTMDQVDKGSDALPLDGFGAIELPAAVRPESPQWVAAANSLYGFKGDTLNSQAMKKLADTAAAVMKLQGKNFPAWALDKAGIEVMLANRIYMGAGLSAPRFRWVSYVDALLFPLSTKTEALATPERKMLFPMEDTLLRYYLTNLNLAKLPGTLDSYLKQVVTPTLESQKKDGCVALKFEAAYLRSLDFEKVNVDDASTVYAHFVNRGAALNEKYKLLQDYIFYYIAREAGRLGMVIHIHSFPAAGNYFVAKDCDPLLLEPVFNAPELRQTKFVILHGGGTFNQNTGAMLWKPNVYADISLMTLLWSAHQISLVLRDWLSQFPEKVLFGTDGVRFGPGLGWEMSACISSHNARKALAIVLSAMVRDNEISTDRTKTICYNGDAH